MASSWWLFLGALWVHGPQECAQMSQKLIRLHYDQQIIDYTSRARLLKLLEPKFRWWEESGIMNLVGGLEHDFYDFPYIGMIGFCHNPTDFHIFQRGRYTTTQLWSKVGVTFFFLIKPNVVDSISTGSEFLISRRLCWLICGPFWKKCHGVFCLPGNPTWQLVQAFLRTVHPHNWEPSSARVLQFCRRQNHAKSILSFWDSEFALYFPPYFYPKKATQFMTKSHFFHSCNLIIFQAETVDSQRATFVARLSKWICHTLPSGK